MIYDPLPSVIYKYDNGKTVKIWHGPFSRYHRINGPAMIECFCNGNVRRTRWCIHGKNHRLDGPADIWYYEDGSIRYERWWINGICIDDIIPWLKENGIIDPLSDEDLMAIKLRWG
jgi:hypothetical protein